MVTSHVRLTLRPSTLTLLVLECILLVVSQVATRVVSLAAETFFGFRNYNGAFLRVLSSNVLA